MTPAVSQNTTTGTGSDQLRPPEPSSGKPSAVRALVALARNVGRNGGQLVVTGSPRLAQLIERAGLSDLVRTASDVDAGIAAAIDAGSDVTGPRRR